MNDASPDPVVYVGVDASLKSLDLFGLPRFKQLPNTAAAHQKLLQRLPPHAHVIMEASGGCEHVLWLTLLRASVKVSRVNPTRVRHYARANGQRAKTDQLDAELLARFGEGVRPAPDVLPTEEMLELQSLVGRREQLVAVHAQQQVQYKQQRSEVLKQQAKELMGFLDRQIRTIEKAIQKLVDASELRFKARRMEQLPGVGTVTSATLLALMPELGQHSDKRLCALAGLAPHPYDSGPMKGQRHIQGGRWRVRRVLYMAAICSLTHNPILKEHYKHLRQKGKPAKVALTALMRKILCVLNKLLSNPNFTLAS